MLTTDRTFTQLYLMWWDDSPKHTLAQKVADAAAVYRERFGVAPNTALINEVDLPASVADIPQAVRVTATIRPNMVWVGVEP
jgi:hypothetical protein